VNPVDHPGAYTDRQQPVKFSDSVSEFFTLAYYRLGAGSGDSGHYFLSEFFTLGPDGLDVAPPLKIICAYYSIPYPLIIIAGTAPAYI
jgi:hypothetical protein